MNEIEVLNTIDSISLGEIDDEGKAIILADVMHKIKNKKTASIKKTTLERYADYLEGGYNEATKIDTYFQDFSETGDYPKAFDVINKNEIDKFLNKMLSRNYEGNYFDDTWDFYHPFDNMNANGVPRNRADFVINNPI